MNIRGALCLIGLWLGTMDDPTAVNDTEAAQALLECIDTAVPTVVIPRPHH